MAVIQLFLRGGAHFLDGDVEVQGFAGQRVVAVDRHGVAVHGRHGDDLHAAAGLGVELHADFNGVDAREHVTRHLLDQAGVLVAIAVGRGDADLQRVTGDLAGEGLFQARDDVLVAVQVGQGLATLGAVDDVTCVVGQGVVDQGDAVLRDLHEELSQGGGKGGGRVPRPYGSRFRRRGEIQK